MHYIAPKPSRNWKFGYNTGILTKLHFIQKKELGVGNRFKVFCDNSQNSS